MTELNSIIRQILQDPYTTSIEDAITKIQKKIDIDYITLIYLINNILS